MHQFVADAFTAAQKTVAEQSARVARELSGSTDMLIAARGRLEEELKSVREMRDRADIAEAGAWREFNKALTDATSGVIAVGQQMNDGRIYTGDGARAPMAPRPAPQMKPVIDPAVLEGGEASRTIT